MSLLDRRQGRRGGERVVALFDVGSGSVRGALAALGTDGKKPRLLHSDGQDFIFHENVYATRLSHTMLATLEKVATALSQAARERGERIEHAMLTFSAPWFMAETKILHYEHDTPIEITNSVIDALIEEAWRRFGTTPSATPRAERGHQTMNENTLIEQTVAHVTLNGYRTRVPIGKIARTVEVALYLSSISRGTVEDIDTLLGRVLPGVIIVPHSSALVFSSVLQDLFTVQENFLLCHVSAEVTELTLMLSGVLLEAISFPYGAHTLVRELSRALKTVPTAALSLLSRERQGIDEKTTLRANEAVRTLSERWLTELRRSLASLADTHGIIPGWFVILGENATMTERFRQFLEGESVVPTVLGTGTLEPMTISEQILGTQLTCEGSALPCMRDIPLVCETLFAQSSLLSTR